MTADEIDDLMKRLEAALDDTWAWVRERGLAG